MTELQTILKETLARWETETQDALQQHQRQIFLLQQSLRSLETRQTESARQWQHLEELCAQLEPLLQRLSTLLPLK